MEERSVRIDKAKAYLEKLGQVFPSVSHRTHTVAQVLTDFASLSDVTVIITGRIRQWREHGKLTFAQLEDASGRIQIALSKTELKQPDYSELNLFDVSDIVEVSGKPFVTHKGQQSILVEKIIMLSKAIQPLPDEWFGLQDEEQRYRRRYVDMQLRPELRDMFQKKAMFWRSLREFLQTENFLEVETPVLETTPGGADAKPFTTHHNALDIDLYLRISMGELWQKRLMVAGFEKTFEIGRQFRNEGISPEHLQDYTQMEFYWAYANYENTMHLVERLYKHVIQATFGKLQFDIKGFKVDFDQPWPRLDYVTAIQDQLNINILTSSATDLKKKCTELNIKIAGEMGKGRLMDLLWKHCRKQIAGPVFLVNHPVAVSPLAKRKTDNPELVERYQVIIAGSELGNGYTELNDPIDQAERFANQAKLRAAGDEEAQRHDQDFIDALEYGMPPTSGFGVSERLFSFLMDKPIRECVMFPLLRPKQ
ncbi:MAG: lysine--tRNA ligase [Patescibacteria group bacterium]|jgi:lysyl-tRNA synthetase class 2